MNKVVCISVNNKVIQSTSLPEWFLLKCFLLNEHNTHKYFHREVWYRTYFVKQEYKNLHYNEADLPRSEVYFPCLSFVCIILHTIFI